jgi:hypothetical protein
VYLSPVERMNFCFSSPGTKLFGNTQQRPGRSSQLSNEPQGLGIVRSRFTFSPGVTYNSSVLTASQQGSRPQTCPSFVFNSRLTPSDGEFMVLKRVLTCADYDKLGGGQTSDGRYQTEQAPGLSLSASGTGLGSHCNW